MTVSNKTTLRCYPEIAYGGYSRVDGMVAFYSRVNALLRSDSTVLDIGCGRGAFMDEESSPWRNSLRIFKGRCARVIGLDVDPDGAGNPDMDEFRLLEDQQHWPIEDASIDLATSNYVLEHVEDPEAFFAECSRVIKPGGHVCLCTPNKYFYVSILASLIPNRFHSALTSRVQHDRKDEDVFPTFYRCNTKRTVIRMMEKAGFDVTVVRHEAEPAYMHFSSIAYRLGAIAHRLMPPPLASTLLIYARKR
ncbi:MAG: methyltransferase domain-containing protein [Phycisphaerales bacterium]|nr:methyltransferase domain-containing protein [Phycisphaerales bacterium]